MEHVVLVGGGPAAHAAARGYRDAGGRAPLLLVTDDDRPPYERPPLSKDLLRGDAGEGSLPMAPAGWYAEQGVEVLHAAATGLDPEARVLRLADGREVRYAGLLLATGAEPNRPPGAEGAHVLRSARDALALRDAAAQAGSAVVVGSGFIGCEAAVSLARRGIEVTLVGDAELPNAARIGTEPARRVAAWLDEEGVRARHGTAVETVDAGGVVAGGRRIDAGLVLLALGVTARDGLARDAGLRLGSGGTGVAADERLRTTGDGVLAAGDCCEAVHPVAGRPLHVEHWGDALAQGEAAGRRLAGDPDARWDVVPGFWSQIGDRWLKHAAWGDGFAEVRVVDHPGGGWTAWYADAAGTCVGVLTHDADGDHDRGRELVLAGAPCPTG